MFKGPSIVNVFSSITNKMQRYTIHLFLQNALHVSGGSSAHHQELKNYIYILLFIIQDARSNEIKTQDEVKIFDVDIHPFFS
jgi:hypothetical protein